MVTSASMGHQTKLGTKDEVTYGTGVTVDQRFVYVSEDIKKRGVIVERDGLRGTRSRQSDDTREGPYTVGGPLVLEPSPEDLAIWLPRILGGTPSGTSYGLAETLPSFTMVIDRVAKVFTYTGCKVARASISGSPGGMIRLAMDIIAQAESVGNAGTFPSLTAGITKPYMFHDLTLTLQSTARECSAFELIIDNALVADRFMNSTAIINAPEGDRIIALNTTHPYASANTDLYGQALAGAAGTLVLAFLNYSTTFTFGTLQVPDNSPTVQGRGEVPLNLQMIARKASTTAELAVTHDSTP